MNGTTRRQEQQAIAADYDAASPERPRQRDPAQESDWRQHPVDAVINADRIIRHGPHTDAMALALETFYPRKKPHQGRKMRDAGAGYDAAAAADDYERSHAPPAAGDGNEAEDDLLGQQAADLDDAAYWEALQYRMALEDGFRPAEHRRWRR